MYDSLPSIDVSSLQERVYQGLRMALLSGHFQPGEPISIRKLAESLGTSPMPVREALKRLMAEKVLVQSSNRQIRVTPFDPQLHGEFVRIRMEIEGYAAERAARIRDAGLVDRLRQANAGMVEAARRSDTAAALAANQAFHFEIYRAAGYSQLVDMIENLWLRTGPFLGTIGRKPVNLETFFGNGHHFHVRAIEAIAARDGKKARRAIALDIRTGTMFLRKIYDPLDATRSAAERPGRKSGSA
ncbi:GntR family transcriptional regulator [Rhodoplanes sp. TEM]|uniref:GntR family transcriptional regulator n=1 Tax=Rhodoplanes tepidamans TaxID=200616 RepID=A0ABT5J8P9_RHOTP|nr:MULTISPECIES: GntR family transcriptional regulator [Rhodoplanes]MDC7785674.1 GntR family transcriptional regulator [Rhodoplanes tepidamans]MDC7983315.1 GntR family transcriptional regulator [Rhodoplanes sp. TEM]MDQ0354759.1 DNA-binding GntR family transcriptional regulator [Rhodoplanes tepidamans]